jgi:hypothetical protein
MDAVLTEPGRQLPLVAAWRSSLAAPFVSGSISSLCLRRWQPGLPVHALDESCRATVEESAYGAHATHHNQPNHPADMPAPSRQQATCCLLPLASGCLQCQYRSYIYARPVVPLQQVRRAGHITCLHHHRSIYTPAHKRAAPIAATSVASTPACHHQQWCPGWRTVAHYKPAAISAAPDPSHSTS